MLKASILLLCFRAKRSGRKLGAKSSNSELQYGLLPQPLHFGKYLRDNRVDFQLPFDIWESHNSGFVSSCWLFNFSFIHNSKNCAINWFLSGIQTISR